MTLKQFKKESWHILFYIMSTLALLGFLIRIGADFYLNGGFYPALPLGLIVERCVSYLLPSILLFIVACVSKRKYACKKANK